MSVSWRENWEEGGGASTDGALNSKRSMPEKKGHVRARIRLLTGKKFNSSSGCWPRRPWKWIFSKVPCKKSRLDTRSAATLARRHLRADPGSDVVARQPEYRAHVSVGGREPQKLLPIVEGTTACRRRDGSAIRHSTDCLGASSPVRLSANHGRATPSRNAGKPQACRTDHAGR